MNKPLVSFCILTYNQEDFIVDAMKGAVSQEYDDMEIIISDDGSSDRTQELIKEFVNNYRGKHVIRTNLNDHNLGIANHYCQVLYEVAKGDILILADGDDISLPTRTAKTVEYFNRFPEVASLSFLTQPVNADLSMGTPYELLTHRPHSFSIFNLDDYLHLNMGCFSGDSRALRRSVIESFPPISIAPAEDYFLYLRSLMIGSICYIREPVLYRRLHGNNVSAIIPKRERSRKNFNQFLADIEWALTQGYIGSRDATALRKKTKKESEYNLRKVLKAIIYKKVRKNKIARKIYYWTKGDK